MHRAWVQVDTKKLENNYKNLVKYLPDFCDCICIVKCNGYGHDAIQEALVLQNCGAKFFGVAALQEAVSLRKAGIVGDILILGHTVKEEMALLAEYNLIQTVGDMDYGYALLEHAKVHNHVYRMHYKIDTGMHRLGITDHVSIFALRDLANEPHLALEGCFSHFAVADSFTHEDIAFTYQQKSLFDAWVKEAKAVGIDVGKLHLSASAAIVNYPDIVYDYCRPGILLLGFDSGDMKYPYVREQVLSLYAQVVKIDVLPSGQSLGYGRTFVSDCDKKIATVSIGYGDGIPRNYKDGEVLIRGVRCPIVGRISMDQMCVDVSHLDTVELFDVVTILNEEITIMEMANKANTISNEIATKLTNRLIRIYK